MSAPPRAVRGAHRARRRSAPPPGRAGDGGLAGGGAAGWLRRPSWAVAATVLCVGVPPGPASPGAATQVTAGDCASAALVGLAACLAVTRRVRAPRAALAAFAPLVLALGVSTLRSADIAASLPGYVRDVQIFVLVPLAVLLLVRDRRDLAIVCSAVLGLGLGESCLGVWQSLTGTGAAIGGRSIRAVGTFGAVDVMALSVVAGFAVLVLTAFALAAPARGPVAVLAAIGGLAVPALALVLALSRGSWIALGVAAVLMLVVYDRWIAARALVCCAALLLVTAAGLGGGSQAVVARSRSIAASVTAPDQSVSDRYTLWAAARRIWEDHPLTGVGVKNFAAYRDTYATIELSSGSETDDGVNGYVLQPLLSPHNEYLLVLSEQGVVGFAGFAALFGVILRGLWTRRRVRDPFWLIGGAFMTFLLINFLYADLGGPTCVLTAVLLGIAAARALGLEPPPAPASAAPGPVPAPAPPLPPERP